MMQATPDGLAAATVNLLRLDPPPSEAEIDDVLARMAQAFGATPEVSEEARRLLHSRFEIRMDLGQTLTSEDEHEPWLNARRASIDPFYWTRLPGVSAAQWLVATRGRNTRPVHKRPARSSR